MQAFLISFTFLVGGYLAFQIQEWFNSKESREYSVYTESIISDPLANAEWIQSEQEEIEIKEKERSAALNSDDYVEEIESDLTPQEL